MSADVAERAAVMGWKVRADAYESGVAVAGAWGKSEADALANLAAVEAEVARLRARRASK
jgi:hypothetical protein